MRVRLPPVVRLASHRQLSLGHGCGEVEADRNPEGLGAIPGESVGGHTIEQFRFAERLAEVVYRPEIIEGVTVR